MAEYLSEEEQLAQLKSWWSRYGWWLVAAVVLGLGGYFLLQYLEESRAETNAAASEVFERYQEVSADEDKANPLLSRLDGEFAGTAYQLMSLMTRAQMATDAGDVEAAIGFFQRAVDAPPIEHFTDVARLRLARALQQQGRSADAISALGTVAGEGYRSLVAELKGDILRAQGKSSEAREAYAAAVEAQGENPRTLLAMKLADLSDPDEVGTEGANTDNVTADDVATDEVATESLDTDEGNEVSAAESDSAADALEQGVDTAVDALEDAATEIQAGAEAVQDAIESES